MIRHKLCEGDSHFLYEKPFFSHHKGKQTNKQTTFFSSTDSWSMEVIVGTLLLKFRATSKQGEELLLVVSNVSLHDVHAWAQQSLKCLYVHNWNMTRTTKRGLKEKLVKENSIKIILLIIIYPSIWHCLQHRQMQLWACLWQEPTLRNTAPVSM